MQIHINIDTKSFKKLFMSKRFILFVLLFIFTGIMYSSVPYTFTAGTQIKASDVNANFTYLNGATVPVGTIVAWHKSMSGTPALPANWRECNGATVSDGASPYNGQAVPNLNSGRFLRGASTSGTMEAESVNPSGLTVDISHTHGSSSVTGSTSSDGAHTHTFMGTYDSVTKSGGYGGGTANSTFWNDGGSGYSTSSSGAHSHSVTGTATGQTLSTTNKTVGGGGSETRPINMSVVWIIKIK